MTARKALGFLILAVVAGVLVYLAGEKATLIVLFALVLASAIVVGIRLVTE